MRKNVILVVSLFVFTFFIFSTTNYAAENEAVVSFCDGEYVAYSADEVLANSKSLNALIDSLGAYSLFFDSLSITEPLSFERSVSLSGTFELLEDLVISTEACVSLDSANITLLRGASIHICGGTLTIDNSNIKAQEVAIALEDDSSTLLFNSGVCASSSSHAIEVGYGTAKLLGGSISSESHTAIINRATLNVCDKVSITALEHHVNSVVPVYSCDGSIPAGFSLKMDNEFLDGGIYPCIIGASKLYEDIQIFDTYGMPTSATFFESYPTVSDQAIICVYKPHKIDFVSDGDVQSVYAVSGEVIKPPAVPDRVGYMSRGWFTDVALEHKYDFATPITGSLTLYAGYSLLSPTFAAQDFSKEYDGAPINVGFTSLVHPLLDSAVITYKWYNNKYELISEKEHLTLINVSDSGEYYCHITFSHGEDKVEIIIPKITVTISKGIVAPPAIPNLVYNGDTQYPTVPSSDLYTATVDGYINAGEYSVTLTLFDSDNYKWRGSDESSITVFYEIARADNVWLTPPSCPNIYETLSPKPTAEPLFGECEYKFYTDSKLTREAALPLSAGEYYCVVYVNEGDNYLALYSEPIKFTVSRLVPISLECTLLNTDLYAFETFREGDVLVLLRLNDGGVCEIPVSNVSVNYGNCDSLRAGDMDVIFSYGELKFVLSVNVKKASFDLSGVKWSALSYTYDGTPKTPYLVNLPEGLTVREYVGAGGTEVGEYTISVVFDYDSLNYEPPIFPSVTIVIEPNSNDASIVRNYVLLSVMLILLALMLFVLLRRRGALAVYIKDRGEKSHTPKSNADRIDNVGSLLSVNTERADELISDALARTLIRKNPISLVTVGTRRAVISLDAISDSYESGSIVDINSLKEKGLAEPNVRYIKVIGGGTVDKPLKIFANAFDLNAVKMIALTGGEANKIRTKRLK